MATITRLSRLRKLAELLDSSWRIPGTPWRIGLDPILGLIPGLGDSAGLLLGAYIIWEAKNLGASRETLTRMTANLAIDGLLGVVPVLGDVFDAAFKSNVRNVQLLEQELSSQIA